MDPSQNDIPFIRSLPPKILPPLNQTPLKNPPAWPRSTEQSSCPLSLAQGTIVNLRTPLVSIKISQDNQFPPIPQPTVPSIAVTNSSIPKGVPPLPDNTMAELLEINKAMTRFPSMPKKDLINFLSTRSVFQLIPLIALETYLNKLIEGTIQKYGRMENDYREELKIARRFQNWQKIENPQNAMRLSNILASLTPLQPR